MSRKLPGATGVAFEAAIEAGRPSNTALSSSESNPSTVAPKAFTRATTPGAYRGGRVYGSMKRGVRGGGGGGGGKRTT